MFVCRRSNSISGLDLISRSGSENYYRQETFSPNFLSKARRGTATHRFLVVEPATFKRRRRGFVGGLNPLLPCVLSLAAADLSENGLCRFGTFVGVGFDALHDRAGDRFAELGAKLRDGRGIPAVMLQRARAGRIARGPGEIKRPHLVGRDAESKNIDPHIGRLATDNFWGHVKRRAGAIAG